MLLQTMLSVVALGDPIEDFTRTFPFGFQPGRTKGSWTGMILSGYVTSRNFIRTNYCRILDHQARHTLLKPQTHEFPTVSTALSSWRFCNPMSLYSGFLSEAVNITLWEAWYDNMSTRRGAMFSKKELLSRVDISFIQRREEQQRIKNARWRSKHGGGSVKEELEKEKAAQPYQKAATFLQAAISRGGYKQG